MTLLVKLSHTDVHGWGRMIDLKGQMGLLLYCTYRGLLIIYLLRKTERGPIKSLGFA